MNIYIYIYICTYMHNMYLHIYTYIYIIVCRLMLIQTIAVFEPAHWDPSYEALNRTVFSMKEGQNQKRYPPVPAYRPIGSEPFRDLLNLSKKLVDSCTIYNICILHNIYIYMAESHWWCVPEHVQGSFS